MIQMKLNKFQKLFGRKKNHVFGVLPEFLDFKNKKLYKIAC